jgi:hypothetical protein
MGRKPVYYRDGGTIPALAYFQQVCRLYSRVCCRFKAVCFALLSCLHPHTDLSECCVITAFRFCCLTLFVPPSAGAGPNLTIFALGLGDHVHAPTETVTSAPIPHINDAVFNCCNAWFIQPT